MCIHNHPTRWALVLCSEGEEPGGGEGWTDEPALSCPAHQWGNPACPTVLGTALRRSLAQRSAQNRCLGNGAPPCPCRTQSRALEQESGTVPSRRKTAVCANSISTDPSWKPLIKRQTIAVFLTPAPPPLPCVRVLAAGGRRLSPANPRRQSPTSRPRCLHTQTAAS